MSSEEAMSEQYRVTTAPDRVPIRRVIASVADKRNLETLVNGLLEVNPDVVFYSTGGTYRRLAELLGDRATQNLVSVSEYTGQKEMAGGLVKTLDYRIYLGLLSDTENAEHRRHLEETGSVPFDMTVVNLYPFSRQVSQHPNDLEGARQNIDIGGPTLIRAAAKNFLRVATICEPHSYVEVTEELKSTGGSLSLATRFRLARRAFAHTAHYDTGISSWMETHSELAPDAAYHLDPQTTE
jgi:phosphoribosylaminoimidazolecarboxamide formyltransferase/IMP cyclohydrolase